VRVAEDETELRICAEVAQLRWSVVAVVADLVPKSGPETRRIHPAIAPRRLSQVLVTIGRSEYLEAGVGIALDHCLAPVEDLIAEMDARVVKTNRLLHFDVELSHPLAFKTGLGDYRPSVVRFDPRSGDMTFSEVVKAMVRSGHVKTHPGTVQLPNLVA
jgi:hypothetical protein